MSKRAIVIGASSGLGKELSKLLARDGYEVGLAARRVELLEELGREISTPTHVSRIDVTHAAEARRQLEALIGRMGGVDLIIISSGVSISDPTWDEELQTIEVNVAGFAALANVSIHYFMERGSGHLVGISSIAALRPTGTSSVYSASKSFVSRYLEGLRLMVDKRGLGIHVTEVQPGYVATPMTEGRDGMFWVAPVDEAARQIFRAVRKRKRHVYITRRWRLVAWVLKSVPYPILSRMS